MIAGASILREEEFSPSSELPGDAPANVTALLILGAWKLILVVRSRLQAFWKKRRGKLRGEKT